MSDMTLYPAQETRETPRAARPEPQQRPGGPVRHRRRNPIAAVAATLLLGHHAGS
ncbi:MAG: hypothetical protein WDN06_11130 [Asticcacaulis sp.]